MSWIPDNTVALASIKMHSKITGSHFESICNAWVEKARINYFDKDCNLLASKINNHNGLIEEEARGSMIGWSILFTYHFDEKFAKQLYNAYKEKFSTNLFIVTLFKERFQNYESNDGDIDSGPILMGYSIPASAFAFGGAVVFNDLRTAKRLQRLIHFGSKEIKGCNEVKYETRFVNMKISPLAEAIMLYLETMTQWNP